MTENTLNLEKEPVILVGVQLDGVSRDEAEDHLAELARLADTAGAEVSYQAIQQRRKPDPAYYIGRGKAEALYPICDMYECDTVIFDDDLSPGQVKNLEKLLECKIIDRSGLILDIFAKNARTREAKTQVELAQLNYLLPRLTRMWTHLSRQVGGIGVRGPGETQLEIDRRLVQKRIEKLQKDLKRIEKQRLNRRKKRVDTFRISLVGYTNAGKSSLMNALTDADVLTEDRLFATLDSTVRKLNLGENREALLSDTVGFIRKLPHHLVAAFRSTLEEVKEANLLLHVIDASHINYREQIQAVNQVLKSMGIEQKDVIPVLNKIDLIDNRFKLADLHEEYKNGIFVSAITGHGLQELLGVIDGHLLRLYEERELSLPAEESGKVHLIHKHAEVVSVDEEGNGICIRYRVRKERAEYLDRLLSSAVALAEE